jgi:hypothetical protein
MNQQPPRIHRCIAALVSAFILHLGSIDRAVAEEPAAAPKAGWENVSEAFTRQIGEWDINKTSPYLQRCQGLLVTPAGDLVMQTAKQGICVSHDQGATWAVVAGNGIAGRCENSSGISIAYPYDGRMAVFCYDGRGTRSGGLSLDGARTWRPFSQHKRGVQTGDVDWSAAGGQTIVGVTHEPFFTLLSADGGQSWRQLDPLERGGAAACHIGMIDAKTLTRYDLDAGSLDWSGDAGATWTTVAYYQVLGARPVHFGRKTYWATAKGIIVSTDGKEWTVTGKGAERARHGPYFGASDQEFVVVTDKAFLKTTDGGASWKTITGVFVAPDMFRPDADRAFFGWDAAHDVLYASGLGGSVYRHVVGRP